MTLLWSWQADEKIKYVQNLTNHKQNVIVTNIYVRNVFAGTNVQGSKFTSIKNLLLVIQRPSHQESHISCLPSTFFRTLKQCLCTIGCQKRTDVVDYKPHGVAVVHLNVSRGPLLFRHTITDSFILLGSKQKILTQMLEGRFFDPCTKLLV